MQHTCVLRNHPLTTFLEVLYNTLICSTLVGSMPWFDIKPISTLHVQTTAAKSSNAMRIHSYNSVLHAPDVPFHASHPLSLSYNFISGTPKCFT